MSGVPHRWHQHVLIRDKVLIVSGYGNVEKGYVQVLKGFEAKVIINDIDPVKAMQGGTSLEGYDDHQE